LARKCRRFAKRGLGESGLRDLVRHQATHTCAECTRLAVAYLVRKIAPKTARKSRSCRLFIAVDINRSKPFFVWHFPRLRMAAMYIPRGGMLDQISGGRILK
jgi:hypothetical protein